MLKKIYALSASLFVCAFISSAHAENNMTEVILERVFKAYGGTDAIAKDESRYETGVTFSRLRGLAGPTKRVFQYPDLMRIEVKYPEGKDIRILNGDRSFSNGNAADPANHAANYLQAVRYILPRLLLENRSKLKATPADSPERAAFEIPVKDGLMIRTEVEIATGYIVRSEGSGRVNNTPISFATEYKDFRNQQGRVVPYLEKYYVMGNPSGHTTLEGVELNVPIPAFNFEP